MAKCEVCRGRGWYGTRSGKGTPKTARAARRGWSRVTCNCPAGEILRGQLEIPAISILDAPEMRQAYEALERAAVE